MKKKGELLTSEVLKTVLAVICIIFLIYLLSALYFSKVNGQKTIQAESSIEGILGGINILNLNGSMGVYSIYDITPVGWWIFSFTSNEVHPNLCSGIDCICICKKSFEFLASKDKQANQCDDNGACGNVERLKEFQEFELGKEDGSFSSLELRIISNQVEVKQI
jgi:hypothetical protein